jgi:hypothetical protein
MVVELSWFQVEDVENPHSGPTTASTTNSTFNYLRDIVASLAFNTSFGFSFIHSSNRLLGKSRLTRAFLVRYIRQLAKR